MATATLDPDVLEDTPAFDEVPGLDEELVIAAQVQDAHVSRKANGATYVVVFEVGLQYLQTLALAGDGNEVYFQDKEVGQGADIRRIGLSKDADNNRHVKLSFQFAQSEIKKSLGRLGTAIAGNSDGILRVIPAQTTVFGARPIEPDDNLPN